MEYMPRICLYCARYNFETLVPEPLGIGYIAAFLIQQQIVEEAEICIVNSLDEAISFKPDIVGVSSVSQVIQDARVFARQCKKQLGCLTILGGYHVTCIPQKIPKEFDLGVLGEGEKTFSEIVQLVKAKNITVETLQHVQGICYSLNGEIKTTEPRELIDDIDQLPVPYRFRKDAQELGVFTSRGCPYRCIFCASHAFWGDTYRLRSADSVVAEINYLVSTYQPRIINILDDLWIAHKQRFQEITKKLIQLKIPDKVIFTGFCRSNIVGEEEIKLLKKLNYSYLRFGAETGSEILLRRLKGDSISIGDHQRVIELCQKHNMPCGASFMFGVPGETRVDIEATVQFLRRNYGRFRIMGFYLFNPLPGTSIWEAMKADGIVDDEISFEHLQLDFLKENFSWDNILYFNNENVSLAEFRRYIEMIREEFIEGKLKEKATKDSRSRNFFTQRAFAGVRKYFRFGHE
jgi:radical SAM superfamily enzyme YgiQ (UPF0313 family)